MTSPFRINNKYFAAEYKCAGCHHETIIFIESKYSMFGFMERDKVCCLCKEKKAILSDGDLILRYDWPDADDDPWQLQAGFMKEEERYCKKCRAHDLKNWKTIKVACSKCDGYMEFSG